LLFGLVKGEMFNATVGSARIVTVIIVANYRGQHHCNQWSLERRLSAFTLI